MDTQINEVEINGIVYVKKDSVNIQGLNDEHYAIVRSRDSGVHAGYIDNFDKSKATVTLKNARRIWYWKGAASISQLAIDGTNDPSGCKFPAPVPEITILGVCEVIPCTPKAMKSIQGVPKWEA